MDGRTYGLVSAYSRYRTGGKPVVWAEFGADIGADGGNSASRAAQAAVCDTMMRQKLEYIHWNPVKRGYVDDPVHWRHSSARKRASASSR